MKENMKTLIAITAFVLAIISLTMAMAMIIVKLTHKAPSLDCECVKIDKRGYQTRWEILNEF